MRKKMLSLTVLGIISLFFPGNAYSENLLPGDSGFESGIGDMVVNSCRNKITWEIDSNQAAEGKQSAKLKYDTKDWTQCKPIVITPEQDGKTFTFTIYAKNDQDGVKGRLYMIKTNWKHGIHGAVFNYTKDWKRYSVTGKLKQGTYWLGVEAQKPCTLWIDAFQLEEGNKASNYKNNTEKKNCSYRFPKKMFPFGILVDFDLTPRGTIPEVFGQSFEDAFTESLKDCKSHYINTLFLSTVQNYGVLEKILSESKKFNVFVCPQVATTHIPKYMHEDNILAWYLKDEPSADRNIIREYIKTKKLINKLDPSRPATSPFCTDQVVRILGPFMEILTRDIYPIKAINNPWEVYEVLTYAREHSSGNIWVFLQAFSSLKEGRITVKWQRPTIPAFKLMTHLALAGGAKGLFYFIYQHYPVWLRDVKRECLSGVIDIWGNSSLIWDEIKTLGEDITSVGSFLLDCKVINTDLVATDSPKTIMVPSGSRLEAIKAYTLYDHKKDYYFIIVVNNDIENASEGNMLLRRELCANKKLYHLPSLEPVPLRNKNGDNYFNINLVPGDGKMFILCPAKEICNVKNIVLKTKFDHEDAILKIKQKEAFDWKLETDKSNEIYDKALSLYKTGKYENALISLRKCEKLLEATFNASDDYKKSKNKLFLIAKSLANIDDLLYKIGKQRSDRTLYFKDEKISKVLDNLIELGKEYFQLKNNFYKGMNILPEANNLHEKIIKLLHELDRLYPTTTKCSSVLPARSTESKNGNDFISKKVILENEFLKTEFDLANGGRASRFILKSADLNLGFMGMDRIKEVPYEYILYDKCCLEDLKKDLLKIKYKLKSSCFPILNGLVFRKTYCLKKETPFLKVTLELENKSSEDKYITPWITNGINLKFNMMNHQYFSPIPEGLFFQQIITDRVKTDTFTFPDKGWFAVMNKKLKKGIIAIVNIDQILKYYFYSGSDKFTTLEWIYKSILIKPHTSWKTVYYLIPVDNLPGCIYASKNLIIDLTPKKMLLNEYVISLLSPMGIKDFQIEVICNGEKKQSIVNKTITLNKLKPELINLPAEEQIKTIVMKFSIDGKKETLSFQKVVNGEIYPPIQY